MAPFAQSRLLDWLYPPLCALCETPLRDGKNLCLPCLTGFSPLPSNACLTCSQSFDGNITAPSSCPNCLRLRPAFDFATAAICANEEAINLIHKFKLMNQPQIGVDLAQLGAQAFRANPRLHSLCAPLLIPVPLHRSRLRQRGFNQAEILAQGLTKELSLSHRTALARTRPTPRQATLTRQQRLKNLQGAFQLTVEPEQLANRTLILVDDVFTTGATANACAQILRKAKPALIVVFTIVRA